jgi:hypothetical protein
VSCNSSPQIFFRLIYAVGRALLILHLNRVSAFRHSCAQVSRHFMSRSPKLRNGALSGLTPSLPMTKCCDHSLMHKALSRFCISQNRNTSCFVSFVSPYCDSRNSNTELNQRSRYELVSTATIGSRYRISRNRYSCCICVLCLLNLRSPKLR